MSDKNKVHAALSINNPNIIFIYRNNGQEVRVEVKPDGRLKSNIGLYYKEIEYLQKFILKK